MRNFFYFLLRHTNLFVFLLLEGLCAALIFTCNDYHRASYVTSANAVSGGFYGLTSSVSKYFGLADANQALAKSNADLMRQLNAAKGEVEALRRALAAVGAKDSAAMVAADSVIVNFMARTEADVNVVSAHVIGSSCTRSRNMLTLDAGQLEGVTQDMAVVDARGVVGLVSAVSARYALVMPIINTSARLSVKLKGTNHRGQLMWDGMRHTEAQLVDVPEYATVEIGDTVVTSGASSFFPEGLLVGTISSIEADRNGGFFNLGVELAVDYNSVYDVQLIDCRTAKERQELENSAKQED